MKSKGHRRVAVTVMQMNRTGLVVRLEFGGSLHRIPYAVIESVDHIDVGSVDTILVAEWFARKVL